MMPSHNAVLPPVCRERAASTHPTRTPRRAPRPAPPASPGPPEVAAGPRPPRAMTRAPRPAHSAALTEDPAAGRPGSSGKGWEGSSPACSAGRPGTARPALCTPWPTASAGRGGVPTVTSRSTRGGRSAASLLTKGTGDPRDLLRMSSRKRCRLGGRERLRTICLTSPGIG